MSERRVLRFSAEAMEGIAREAMAAFNAIPRRGAETGGLLLGREAEDGIEVRDFEPVLCSHRFGPSFLLDETDRKGLEESLTFFAGDHADALPAVGLFRSNTRAQTGLDVGDFELVARYFEDRPVLFLLLQPARDQSIRAELWQWTGRDFLPLREGLAFPFAEKDGVRLGATESAREREAPHAAAEEPAAGQPAGAGQRAEETPAPPAREPAPETPPSPALAEIAPAAPAPAPRLNWTEPERRNASRSWLWTAAALVLVIPGAYLGYRVAQPRQAQVAQQTQQAALPQVPARPAEPAPPPATEPAAPTTPEEQPAAAAPGPDVPGVPAENEADRAEPDPRTAVRGLLDEWAAAHRSGEPREVAHLYTPSVSRYLGRRNLSRADVSNQVAAFISVHGTPVIFRLSDVRVEVSGPDAAVATFRKHWQTRGARMYAGEEEVRLSLVRRGGDWKIAAEDELRVYWTEALR